MKTDKELLQLAARAVGLVGEWTDRYNPGWYENKGGQAGIICDNDELWNPLTNDGDALRLAVDLGLGISIPIASKVTDVVCFSHSLINIFELHGTDKHAATRRAIVRAAAAIGEGME